MTPRNAAEISLGIAGIYFLAENVPAGVLTLVTAFEPGGLGGAPRENAWVHWLGSLHVILMLATGVALVRFRQPLAEWLTRNMDEQAQPSVTPNVHAAAVSVLGLFFFVPGLASLLSVAALASERMPFSKSGFSVKNFIQPATQTLLGAGLFLGARGIVRAWATLRTGGSYRGDGT